MRRHSLSFHAVVVFALMSAILFVLGTSLVRAEDGATTTSEKPTMLNTARERFNEIKAQNQVKLEEARAMADAKRKELEEMRMKQKEEMEAKQMEMKAKKEEMVGTMEERKGELEMKKVENKNMLEARKASSTEQMEQKRSEMQAKLDEKKAEIEEKTKERVKNFGETVVERLLAATTRLTNIAVRIDERIQKLETQYGAEGLSLTDTKATLALARTAIKDAEDKANSVLTNLETALSSENPRESLEGVKKEVRAIIESIKKAHGLLRETVETLKKETRAFRDSRASEETTSENSSNE